MSSKISNKRRMPTLTTFTQRSIGIPSHNNQTRKRKKRKGINKTVTICIDMITCIDSPKEPTKKLLELINKFSKVVRYKINIKKAAVFL